MATVKAKSPLFDNLAEKYLRFKAEEKEHIDARRSVGEEILGLPEVEENRRDKGSVTFRGQTHEIEVTFIQSEVQDMAAIAAALPAEAVKRIFPSVPTFTRSGMNAYLKELDGQGVVDPKCAKLAKKIRETLAAHTTTKPGATQFSVSKIDT